MIICNCCGKPWDNLYSSEEFKSSCPYCRTKVGYKYYIYHLGKTQVETIGVIEETDTEIKGIILESNFKEDVGTKWSNKRSYLDSPEYDFSQEYMITRTK